MKRSRLIVLAVGAVLVVGGTVVAVGAGMTRRHPPSPPPAAAGSIGPGRSSSLPRVTVTTSKVVPLDRSVPVHIDIPSIGVASAVFDVGRNPDGTIEVPPLDGSPRTNEAAWYRYSPTPGQLGPSVIEGHVDSERGGPSVFYRLGDVKPGDRVDVTLADGQVARFDVSGVREYPKATFPTQAVYGNTDHPALRLITCGGTFDRATGHYESNIVVFASLVN